jgi:hypothetical protein
LAFTAAGVAIAQTAQQPPSDEEVQSAVDKATAVPFPEVGGPRAAGVEGEVSLGSMRALYSATDVTVKSALGPVSFVRYYGLDTRDHTSRAGDKRPHWTPFGSMRADTTADTHNRLVNDHCSGSAGNERNCRGGLRWWHNFESWVDYTAKEIDCNDPEGCDDGEKQYTVTWNVHAPDGSIYNFEACSLVLGNGSFVSQCYARNLADTDVKLVRRSNGSPTGGGFVLHTPAGRYVYAKPWNETIPPYRRALR